MFLDPVPVDGQAVTPTRPLPKRRCFGIKQESNENNRPVMKLVQFNELITIQWQHASRFFDYRKHYHNNQTYMYMYI